MFDQWVPDEPQKTAPPRVTSRLGGVAASLGATLADWRRGRIDPNLWAHCASVFCAVMVVWVALLAPERAQGQRFDDTMRLFRLTGGDLSDKGMASLVSLDHSAASIANRLAPLPPAPVFNGPGGGGLNEGENPPVLNLPGLTPEQARMINAAIPISIAPNPAAKPFFIPPSNLLDEARATDCLTAAVYYEAANEPLEGRQAVAQVILNRMRHPQYPKSVCGVVFQGSNRKTGCQFSFTCDGSLYRKPSEAGWRRSREVAVAALNGFVAKQVGQATHYHADYVAPYWSTSLLKIGQIGAHIFYRWTGSAGQPRAFDGLYAGMEPGVDLAGYDLGDPAVDALLASASLGAAGLTVGTADAFHADGGGLPGEAETAESSAPPAELPAPDIDPAPAPIAEAAPPPPAQPAEPQRPTRGRWNRLPVSR